MLPRLCTSDSRVPPEPGHDCVDTDDEQVQVLDEGGGGGGGGGGGDGVGVDSFVGAVVGAV
jgi:hypothetical protein